MGLAKALDIVICNCFDDVLECQTGNTVVRWNGTVVVF